LVIPAFAQQFAEFLEPTEKQSNYRWASALHLRGNLGHGHPFEVMKFDNLALVFRQSSQGSGKAEHILATFGFLSWRRLVGDD
jgi:hypothetical protein